MLKPIKAISGRIKKLFYKRISVYLYSGNVLYLRDRVATIIVIKNERYKNEFNFNERSVFWKTGRVTLNIDRIESVQVREWYETWG